MTKEEKEQIMRDHKTLFTDMKSEGHIPILVGLGGSHAYGTNIEGSDIDVRGIYLNKEDELLGLTPDKEQYVLDDLDTTIYSLKKAAILLASCNPAMIEVLNCREEDYLYLTEEGKVLKDKLEIFLSKRAAKTFGGYAKSQLNRLINRSGRSRDLILENEERSFEKSFMTLASRYKHDIKNPGVRQDGENLFLTFSVDGMPISEVAALLNEFNSIDRGYRKSVRNDKATTHGKLAKHMMHLIRLYMMGIELLETHQVHTYRNGDDHELLMSIRNGDYLKEDGLTPTDSFNKLVEDYSTRFESAAESTTLPDNPDMNRINDLLIKLNRRGLS